MSKHVNNTKFHGLSSPEELQKTWFDLTNNNDLCIIWDFKPDDVYNLSYNTPYIINILYNFIGNDTGHYIAIYIDDNDKVFKYFDPLTNIPYPRLLNNILTLSTDNGFRFVVDLSGSQRLNENSCGYHCLTKLYDYSILHNNIKSYIKPAEKVAHYDKNILTRFESTLKRFTDITNHS